MKKHLLLSIISLIVVAGCTSENPEPDGQGGHASGTVAVSLKNDFSKDGFVVYMMDDETSTRSSSDVPVFFYTQGENVDVLYYNGSAEKAHSDLLKEGILVYYFKNEGDWVIKSPEYQLCFREISENLYNVAIVNPEGEKSYLYGLTIADENGVKSALTIPTKISAKDRWHITYSAILKVVSFAVVAVDAVIYMQPLGAFTTAITEAMKSDYFDMRSRIGEDRIQVLEYMSEFMSLKTADYLGVLASEINRMADQELDKAGRVVEVEKPELGEEWNIRVSPPFLRCPNNNAQYTVDVSSKAMWKIDDSQVDKTWCSVEKSGNSIIVTITENNNPGTHSCSAYIVQAVESSTYSIAPKELYIELFGDVQFSLHPKELVFGKKGGSKPVMVNMSDNITSWSVDKHPDWCTIERGDANYSFWVNVVPSENGHEAEPIIVYGAVDEDTFFRSEVLVRQEGSADEMNALREKLIKFYNDTGGPTTWKCRDNWCSEKPLNEWYGVTVMNDGKYSLNLDNNGLSGYGDLSNTPLYTLSIWQDDNNSISLDLSNCRQLYKVVVSVNELNVSDSAVQSITGLDGDPIIKRLVARRSGLLGIGGFGRENKIDNIIEYIDVSGSNELDNIHATYCSKLTTIVADECKNLNIVRCTQSPKLESISVAGCDRLSMFSVDYVESLTQVDLSSCSGLKHFTCNYGGFTSADLSDCIQLEYLQFWHNPLSSISFPASPVLRIVALSDNALTSLDISQLPGLEQLYCANNHIIQEITPRFHEVFHWPNQISHQWEVYDRRYDYEWGYVNGNYVLINVIEHPYGWYYPGEPEKGYHGQ